MNENMIAPATWPKPFYYRRDTVFAARPGFSRFGTRSGMRKSSAL
jgi:hypothetical protein